jgi:glycyl-tRNA synthetase beta subunit
MKIKKILLLSTFLGSLTINADPLNPQDTIALTQQNLIKICVKLNANCQVKIPDLNNKPQTKNSDVLTDNTLMSEINFSLSEQILKHLNNNQKDNDISDQKLTCDKQCVEKINMVASKLNQVIQQTQEANITFP